MQLTIIKKNKLTNLTLPDKVEGNYWITDFENGKKINLINIEANNGEWQIISNQDAFIVDDKDVMMPHPIIKEYGFYILKNNYRNEKYYLYCSPNIDSTYKELGLSDKAKIRVGSDKSCEIAYQLNTVPKVAFLIEKQGNYYYISIQDKLAQVYINQKRIYMPKRLEYGDIVFIFGLKIILMRRNGKDYLLINSPNSSMAFSASFSNVVTEKDDFIEDDSELSDDSLFKDSNYFYRTPHFYNELETFSLEIDPPPAKKEKDETPALLTIGPMLTMSMTSVVMMMSSISNMSNGNSSAGITSLVMSGAMLASCLLWPLLMRAYQKFADSKYEHQRQKKYKNYIDKKEKEIEKHVEKQKNYLLENNLSVADTQSVIKGHNVKLWQRRISDTDFLTLPVGIGNSITKIDIKYPSEHFSMSDDNLLDIALELGKKERILQEVPITFSFYDNISTGIIGDAIITKEFIDRFVLQIMANYSYDEVKLVTFTSMENEKDWDYIKILPHSWSNDKTMRYFGSSNEDYSEIIYVLDKIYNERKSNDGENQTRSIPHYIIITDAIKSIDTYDFIKDVMSSKYNVGFSVVMLVDKLSALPNECKNFINVNRDECGIFSSAVNLSAQRFKMDFSPIDDIYNCARELANIEVNIKSEVEASLPDIYQFMEMYQVGKVEQFSALDRWKKSNPILSLRAPIGIGKSGELISLDLHEKYHGPHGLIAGTTGSGKSEFIITYILSLAINYHPYEVQMILIDYKGGSLAGAFTSSNYRLPHLAGTITNLDGNELNRSLASIESEVKRRQAVFNEARKVSNESTIDIYKYQKLHRENKLKDMEPVSHLLIISDEFAELKEQQPEFMDKLISIARVGRSLGIHLILATQKPGGVVDSQIWSNTRFRVSLKVQDTSDSQEVLKKPDAAYLKKTGRFYLQVGYDEVYTLGQSAWAGGQYYPSTTFKKEIDKSVNIINNVGYITMSREPNVVKEEAQGEELPAIVKYLSDLAEKENIKIRKLWLDKIPEKIYIDDLKTKYKFQRRPYFIEPIIGEYDDPSTQNQYVLTIPFSRVGNALVYGIAGSGKEMFIESLIYSTMTSYAPEEVNFYIMDFGAETLRVFNESPYVGDFITINEPEKISNLFKMINEEIENRKRVFSSFGGSYQSYIEESGKSIPNYIVIINNYEAFYENYEDMSEELGQILRDANKYGIFFIITATNDSSMRMRMKQNFALNYVLQQNNDDEYSSILGNARGKAPAKLKGRGLFKKENIYEFQTARIKEDNNNKYVKELCKKYKDGTKYRAKKVPVLPEVVDFEAIKDHVVKSPDMVIGVNKKTLLPEKYNFKKNSINCISSYDLSNTYTFVNALVDENAYIQEYELLFINTSEQEFINENLKGRIAIKDFDSIFNKFADFIDGVYESYQMHGFNEDIINKQRKYMIMIYGLNDFINKLSEENKRRFSDIINKDNQMGLISFVLIDSPDIIKTYSYEEWFRSGVDLSRGIWIGSGIFDQTLFKISKLEREDREEISIDFGFIIQGSKANRIKLLSSFKDEQN